MGSEAALHGSACLKMPARSTQLTMDAAVLLDAWMRTLSDHHVECGNAMYRAKVGNWSSRWIPERAFLKSSVMSSLRKLCQISSARCGQQFGMQKACLLLVVKVRAVVDDPGGTVRLVAHE